MYHQTIYINNYPTHTDGDVKQNTINQERVDKMLKLIEENKTRRVITLLNDMVWTIKEGEIITSKLEKTTRLLTTPKPHKILSVSRRMNSKAKLWH